MPMTKLAKLTETLTNFKAEFISVNPEWAPLENNIPEPWWDGFMFMGRNTDFDATAEPTIYLYKHGITRHYLNIDAAGNFYKYNGGGYDKITEGQAVEQVFEGLEALGATPSTIYDDEYKAQRNKALAEMGYTVIG